jgi:DedD protein
MTQGRLNIMERRLKERLVGATILVVLIVLLVPELLSGPSRPLRTSAMTGGSNDTVRNVTVDLATSKATPAPDSAASAAAPMESQPPVESPPPRIDPPQAADGDRSDQAPPTPDLRVDHGAPPSITTPAAQPPLGAAVENPSPPPSSPSVRARSKARQAAAPSPAPHPVWAVQTGSFASRANAEKQVRRLKAHESSVYLSSGGKGSALRYRVRVGPYTDRAAAERALARLRQQGESASLVAP